MEPNIRPVLLFRVCLLACICGVAFSQTAPTITVDKLVAKLYQYQTTMTQLIRVTCVTSPPGKTCRVSNRRIHPTNPCGGCFTTLPNCQGKKEDYCIWFVPDQGFFNPRIVSKYLITLEAEDADGLASQRLVDIRIITNSPPYFNYPNQSLTVVMSDSEGKKAGAILATVSATDDNNDQLTYTMTTVPDTKKNIVIDSFSGAIRTTKALRELCLTSVTCLVKVQDPHSKAVGPFIVNLELKNGNHPPLITNLNAALYLREDEPIGKVLLQLKIVDNRKYGNLQYTFSTIPPSMENYFFFKDGDDTLRVKQRLDFETQPHSIIMNVQATDSYCASELYTLDIRLVDVNEPPTLQPPPKIIETCEGWLDLVPVWNASDPDKGDSWTFTDVQPNKFGRFKIFEKSGSIASTVNYDVDASRHPASLELIVTLSDQQLLTATATVSVRVLDCNDNAPVFSKGSKDFKVTPCVPLGTVLGVVPKATDLDSDFRQNNVITYSGSSGLVTVDKDGNVVLAGVFKQGQHITFPAYASDKGEHPGPLTSKNPLWVSVYAEPCTEEELRTTTARPNTTTTTPTTTTPPTTTGPNSAEGWSANEIWILTGAVLATALLLLALFMCVRYICPRCLKSCQRTHGGLNEANTRGFYRQEQHQQQQKNQQRHGGDDDGKESWSTDSVDAVLNNPDPSPEPTKRGPGFIFGWWKETFADTDYSNSPKRNAPPEPSKGPDKIFTHTFDPAD